MEIKKLTFCILCSVNAANLAADEDLNNEKSSISTVEENVLIKKMGKFIFFISTFEC